MQLDCENDAGKCPKVPGKVCTVVPASGSRSSIGDRATARHKNERPPPHQLTPSLRKRVGAGAVAILQHGLLRIRLPDRGPSEMAWGTVCRRSCNSPAMSWSARSRGPDRAQTSCTHPPVTKARRLRGQTTAEQQASSPTTPNLSVKARHPQIPNLQFGALIDLPSVTGPVSGRHEFMHGA
jgi:hypothetical protein